tara:strand:+ start:1853 stop:2332 length:480 start_codon:yes stop_codon:yes gene_type:complete
MTLIVEDGTGKADAQTYLSEAGLAAYALARGVSITGNASVLLLGSMTYVESLDYRGHKNTKLQALQHPRYGLSIDGFEILTTEIVQVLKDLQAEVAIAIDSGNDPLETIQRAVKKTKVGPIEKEYTDNAAPFVVNLRIKALERKLTSGMGGSTFTVSRG